MRRSSVIIEFIIAALILLLVYASLSKLLSYPVFVARLHTHPLLKPFAGFIARALPLAELAVAALLAIPRTRLLGLCNSVVLLLIFTAYLAIMLLSYKNLPCSCGCLVSKLYWGGHIVFNSVFIVLFVTGIILYKRGDKTALSFSP